MVRVAIARALLVCSDSRAVVTAVTGDNARLE
jgi:hypothetical protein